MKILCIDCGNTFCKAAIVENNVVIYNTKFHSQDYQHKLLELINKYKPTYSVLSSVINSSNEIFIFIDKHLRCIELTHEIHLPFSLLYKSPETLGKDRLALAAAAAKMFPNQNNLVIACGTCITYNFINQQNEFLGGGISPGLIMRFNAMHHFTQKLPLAHNINKVDLIGTDTISSLQSGVVNGTVAEIDGIIDSYNIEHSKINVVLTGGDMPQLDSQLKSKIFADANFLFKGLYEIGLCNIH